MNLIFLRRLYHSFWLVPTALIASAFVASIVLTWLDHQLPLEDFEFAKTFLSSSPEGARSILSTIAGSTITVAGVILSTTIVVLTLASQQYGPRLLRNFIEDRASQFVIGFFSACFIYSILILRNIRSGDYEFVPHLSVVLAVLAAVTCICLMIYFIHHVSVEIQVQSIIARVHRDLRKKIDQLFPSPIGSSRPPEADRPEDADGRQSANAVTVKTDQPGYLQAVSEDALIELCQRLRVRVHIDLRPGEFVFENDTIARIESDDGKTLSEDDADKIRETLLIGRFATSEQDVCFPIQQLEEIAVRALSPGINDPHTAVECLNYLASALCTLATREFPTRDRYDEAGKLRVVAQNYRYATLLKAAFQKIHFHGKNDPDIVDHLFHVLAKIAGMEKADSSRRSAVVALAKDFIDISESSMPSPTHQAHIRETYRNSFRDLLTDIL